MAAKAFEIRTICPDFNGLAAILHSKTGLKKCLENDHSNSGRSGFRMLTVKGSENQCSKNSNNCATKTA
jgi:hypothetical protein